MLHSMLQTAVRVHLRLDRSLRLCDDNETDTDCCPKPLCVLETLQLSACLNGTLQTSLLIQARIYAQLFPVSGEFGRSNIFFFKKDFKLLSVMQSIWHFSLFLFFYLLQKATQLFQTSFTKHLARAPVISHSGHVTYAAAVIRSLTH